MMKKHRKIWLTILLALSLLLSACGDRGESVSPNASNATNGDKNNNSEVSELPPYEVNLVFYGPAQKDLDRVAEEMSKITKEKINATVKLVRIEPAAWDQQSILMLTSTEQVDLIVTGGSSYSRQVAQGQLLPLDNLLQEHGPDIIKAFQPEVLAASKVNGETYAVPSIRDFAADPIVLMRTDLLEKHQLKLDDVKQLDDLDPIFQVIKENEPNINVLGKASAAASIANRLLETQWDILGDYIGVLKNLDELTVVNLYETPEYADMLNTIRRWYLEGYINKDAATSNETAVDYIKANVGFAAINKGKPGAIGQTENRTETKLSAISLGHQITSTTNITSIMLGIPTNSKDPARAMMFLNLLNSDPDLVNLINWGIEGEHYAKVSDTSIDFPPGVDSTNSGFNLRQGWMFGNQLLSYTWATDIPNLWEEMDKFNNESKKSVALGFTYNPIPVKTELAAISNVTRQYSMALETGTLDPEINLPKFIAALKDAGIDKVIAEKQKQLDEWAKNK